MTNMALAAIACRVTRLLEPQQSGTALGALKSLFSILKWPTPGLAAITASSRITIAGQSIVRRCFLTMGQHDEGQVVEANKNRNSRANEPERPER